MKLDKNDSTLHSQNYPTQPPLAKTKGNEIKAAKIKNKDTLEKINKKGTVEKVIDYTKSKLTEENIEKIKNGAKKLVINETVNKISPFFNPAGLLFATNYDKKIKTEITNKNKSTFIISDLKNKLKILKEKIKNTPEQAQGELLKTKERILSFIKNYQKINQQSKKTLKYLENQKNLELAGSFTGNLASVVDLFVPGTKRIVDIALTSGRIALQEKAANALSSDSPIAKEEQKNIRNRTWLTVAAKTAVITFSILSFPSVRQGLASMGVPFL